ncbi:transcriptional regulator NrdR [Aeromicrobium duanguangcaii]|uniref:transcriptional regulator NrdR n=1 Tax=Aeromicrobium duanguangcaii TaxID=2968086 RepID=UPI00201710F9|nr:transcriptional regulator NrdR [Aeromicrobium duanguangcaii]MCL3836806.1 transcriptional regulator NrdR [Aeromicrobium duanguangcaii]
MHCPFCKNTDTRVLDSRVADEGGSIRRRRACSQCEKRFTTIEQMQLMVVKRSGATEPFVREKAVAGVAKACKGRPVSTDDLACLGQQVEDALRASGQAEINTQDIGMAILEPLRALDEVAYLRFASVYKSFDSADDFVAEIAGLMADQADIAQVLDRTAEAVSPKHPDSGS